MSRGTIALGEIMVSEVLTVVEDETMQRAAMFFKEFPFHHLPVVNQDIQIVGMLSSSDLAQISSGFSLFSMENKAQYDDAIFQTILVKDVMSRHVFGMSTDDTIRDAYEQFRKGTFRAIPILDEGQIVGIVTPLDLVAGLIND